MNILLNNSTEILLSLFLAITFVQSGLDKLFDWGGNLSWLKGHFENTPLKNMVPLLLGIVLALEVVAGILCAIGIVQLARNGETELGFYGAILSCVVLLMLLFGQRVAKDYDGARTIVIYFVPAILLVYLLQG
ncbi:MAG: DoxX family membrane protein [Maribacter sp.]|uniref:DoxX family membrane protein n=1 Tax=Maribacter sp. TaxID=1897614 RepID=UPI003C72671D